MKIDGIPFRTIWLAGDGESVEIIDQTRLPHELVTVTLTSFDEAAHAISNMLVRGAPLIGATAAYGVALAMREDPSDDFLDHACRILNATRPTAVNLCWALDEMRTHLSCVAEPERRKNAYRQAARICDDDVETNRLIGMHGLREFERLWRAKEKCQPLNVLTHCNAGWLATVDWGTALSPVYQAHDNGMPIHVWVDETRPRNQGAGLTAWELGRHGVAHTVIADNVGGHLMQHGLVDVCITGTDRTTASGDVCNKIGTYLKALAAFDNDVPFFVGLPGPTIDWNARDGIREIPIEQRDPTEVTEIVGCTEDGCLARVRITPKESPAANYAFDVTPARLVSALITERGICQPSLDGLLGLYPERRSAFGG